jgi:hypothetical protein
LLKRDSAGHCLDRTGEFHQDAIAFDPNHPPSMSLDARPNHLPKYTIQTTPRTDLVLANKPTITHHVGKQDCCQTPLDTLLRLGRHFGLLRRGVVLDMIAKTNGASLDLERDR